MQKRKRALHKRKYSETEKATADYDEEVVRICEQMNNEVLMEV